MGDENKYLQRAIIGVVVVVLLIVVYGIYINAASRTHVAKMENAQYVSLAVAKVQYRELHAALCDLNLDVKSKWMVDIQAQLEGTIKGIYVKQGDKVKAGQLLLMVENPDLPAQIAQADGLIAQAQANLVSSKKTLDRLHKLVDIDGISQQQYDEAVASYDTAVGNLESTKAQKEALLVSQGKSAVRAPQDADVLRVYRQQGDYIHAGDAAILLGDLSQLYFRTVLLDSDLKQIMPLDGEFELQIDIYSLEYKTFPVDLKTHSLEHKISLKAVEIEPELKISSKYRYVNWLVQNDMGLLEPTTYSGARIVAQKTHRVLSIPCQAVSGNTEPHVWVVDADNVLQSRAIKTGISDDQYIEVREGLAENEAVVISDQRGLSAGTRVRETHE